MTKEQEKHDNENYSKNFTRVPNIIFMSYKYLTKEEKFLYCTLRQVYWDMKPRFVSTRELSDLTGYSRSALASMLPRLHICGLIHAEIRHEKGHDGKAKGHAKYHITVIDIWEINRKYFEASPEEQAKMDPSLKIVHEKDNNIVHEKGQNCPPNKPELSMKKSNVGPFGEQSQAQVERAKDNKDISKDRMKERPSHQDVTPNDSTGEGSSHSFIHSSLISSSLSEPKVAKPQEVIFPEEAEQVYQLLVQLNITCLKRDEIHRDNCMLLAKKGVTTTEKLESLMQACWQQPYLKDKPLNLKNLINALPGWLQTQEKPKPLKVGEMHLRPLNDLRAQHEAMVKRVKDQEKREISDEEIVTRLHSACGKYDDFNLEEAKSKIDGFKSEFGINNRCVYTSMASASAKMFSVPHPSTRIYLNRLQEILINKAKESNAGALLS